MIRNYFIIAWRNLKVNKVSSLINISGLALGLACVLLIGLYIKDEFGYDSFFKDGSRIYRVNLDGKMGDNAFIAGHTPPPAGAALQHNFPEVESFTRIFKPGDEIIHYTNHGQKNSLTERGLLSVDSNFLQFFSYQMVAGDRATCLNAPNAVVLTERAAKKYFGETPAMGKTLIFDEYATPFTVTGILKDLPAQSSLQFDLLQSNTGMPPVKRFYWSWVWLQMATYVKLKPNVAADASSISRMESKFPTMIREQAVTAFARIGQPFDAFKKKGGHWDLHLQPLTRVHLFSGGIVTAFMAQGDIKNVYILGVVALFIMLLACVNFMNLSTAQSAKRSKEVGIRKVLGSLRGQLMRQFMVEALLYSLFAVVVALLIVGLVLPAFNQLANKSLSMTMLLQPATAAGIVLLVAFTALLAGSYPAFFLTSMKPVSVLKGGGAFSGNGKQFTRNALVVFQFCVSTILIISTIIVYKQLRYNQTKDLGLDKENVVIIRNADRLDKSEESMRQELSQMPGIAGASISSGIPTGNSFTDFYVPEAATPSTSAMPNIALSSFEVDESFMPALKLKMASGRGFSKLFADSASVILNQAAAKQIGWKDAVGKYVTYPGNGNQRFKVIGVMKDFNIESLHTTIAPFALFHAASKSYHVNSSYIVIRIKPGDYQATISSIQNKWKQFLPDTPFEYSFLDAEFDSLYRADQTIGQLITAFTSLSLFVACLGLLGLAIYTAERRTKEIGIRKVLGASVGNVVAMLSTDFLKLVILATVIAFPFAWYGMRLWLQDFAYPTPLNWWVFALSAGITIVIALVTVSFQSVKAALSNPVKSLRSE